MFGPLWLLAQPHVVVLIGYIVVVARANVAAAESLGDEASFFVSLILSIWFRLRGDGAATLGTGAPRWRLVVAVVEARRRIEAERRYYTKRPIASPKRTRPAAPIRCPLPCRGAHRSRPPSPPIGPLPGGAAMSVVIIDYGSGNLRSAEKAFLRAAAETGHPAEVVVSADPERVARAERVVLPGVGAFAELHGRPRRHRRHGRGADRGGARARRADAGRVRRDAALASCGLEHRTAAGLAGIAGDVRHLEPADPALKIPHMGWNVLEPVRPHPVLADIPTGPDGWHAYFVHSYAIVPTDESAIIARADHGGLFAAIVGRDNFVGTQFHPDKTRSWG
ncbi:MAG: hypothetical protein AcusKO_10630 [Acuticoccus sp.]